MSYVACTNYATRVFSEVTSCRALRVRAREHYSEEITAAVAAVVSSVVRSGPLFLQSIQNGADDVLEFYCVVIIDACCPAA